MVQQCWACGDGSFSKFVVFLEQNEGEKDK